MKILKKIGQKTKLIKGIKEYESGSYKCITVTSNYVDTKPLCSKDGNLIDYHLVNKELKEENSNKID